MIWSYLCAVAAALAYGVATVVQAIAVARLAELTSQADWGARARAGWPYAFGLALDGVGFLVSLVALQRLPLFLVESLVASSVAVTAVLAALVLKQRLTRLETGALAVLIGGLAALALSSASAPARAVTPVFGWSIAALALPLAVLAAYGVRTRAGARGGLILSAIAGAAFGMVGVAGRLFPAEASPIGWLASPYLWALCVHGVLAVVAYGYALDRLKTTTVASLTFTIETVLPSLIGLGWLGDEVLAGRAWLAVLGFAATLAGCLALASRAEVEPTLGS